MGLIRSFDILASGMAAQRARADLVASNLANAETTRTEEGGPYKRRIPVFAAAPAAPEDPNAPIGALGLDETDPLDADGFAAALRRVEVVEVHEDERQGRQVFEPNHPDADDNGFVFYPNVNVVEEMVDLVSASRGFQATAEAFMTLKGMIDRSLDIGR